MSEEVPQQPAESVKPTEKPKVHKPKHFTKLLRTLTERKNKVQPIKSKP